MALKRIVLRDFVIVAELDLDLIHGFTVLTGETGAGKSILIDAVQLVTGARADAGMVREGAARADVSAEFDGSERVTAWLAEQGFDAADSLLLRRTVDAAGKSRAWVNGSPATAAQLRAVGEQLLDIHGQHAWQSLTQPDAVRNLLDAYAQLDSSPLPRLWDQWRHASEALKTAQAAQDSLQQERERLMWQVTEVGKLAPRPNEWAELSASHSRLSNAQALLDAAHSALQSLDADDNGALAALHRASLGISHLAHLEPQFQGILDGLAAGIAQAEDAAHSLRAYARRDDLDPKRLAEMDERMALWMSLARRFKRPATELPTLLASWQQELVRLDAASDIASLQAIEQASHQAYMLHAQRVSKARVQAAPNLAQSITLAMQGLGMQGGKFEVAIDSADKPGPNGLDAVHFLAAGHAGSSPRPVNKVASGGELSRMALAIAVTTSRLGNAPTLIFDEVDAGVGGAVAETVGRLLRQLGVDRQVLAVTHLPQVAACANQHLVVAKELVGSATQSSVNAIHGERRVAEIARMLAGQHLSSTSLAHAKEMLQTQP